MKQLSILIMICLTAAIIFSCGLAAEETYLDLTLQNHIEAVSFSRPSGFYAGPLEVEMTSGNPSDVIYYTTDGSQPNRSGYTIATNTSSIFHRPELPDPPYYTPGEYPPYSQLTNTTTSYSGGDEYYGALSLTTTTLIRARAYRNGIAHGPDAYATYFIDESLTLPVFSLAVGPTYLWDDLVGIYVVGTNTQNPMIGSYDSENYFQRWERPVHIEYFTAAGGRVFAQDGGVRIFGGWSRDFAQKSLALFARQEYGSLWFNYDFFGLKNNRGQSISKFNALVLRNSGDDWVRTMFRDGCLQSLTTGLDVERQAYRPALVCLNGQYWGIQNIREKVNEDFLAAHYDYVNPAEVDILQSWDSDVVEGDNREFKKLMAYIQTLDLSQTSAYNYVCSKIDINNFIDYFVFNIYINNTDWPGSNVKYWKPRLKDAKWRWIVYDTDGSFGGKEWAGAINDHDHDTIQWVIDDGGDCATIFTLLLNNSAFKTRFAARFRELMAGTFAASHVQTVIDNYKNAISAEIPRHNTLWGAMADFDAAVQVMLDFASDRAGYVETMLTSHGL